MSPEAEARNSSSRPANVLLGYYKNSEHPTDGAESQVRIQINLLFPQTGG